jgi:hypothetical protein
MKQISVYKITQTESGEVKRAMTLPEATWERIVAAGSDGVSRFELRTIEDNTKETVLISDFAKKTLEDARDFMRTESVINDLSDDDTNFFTAESVEEKTEELKEAIEKTIFEMDMDELKALAKERKIKGAHLIKTREKLIEILTK